VTRIALCAALGLALLAGCGEDGEQAARTTPATTAAPTATETSSATVTEAPPTTEATPTDTTGTTETTAPVEEGAPTEPPPNASEPSAPPPAWFESSAGKVWLAYGSYCWASLCVDKVQASCEDMSTPAAQATQGETVRFHLRFQPTEAMLSIEDEQPRRLPNRRTIPWDANASGLLQLFVRAHGGDVTYAACLTIVGA
jgi:type IV secretory pathway VirB10-like protein